MGNGILLVSGRGVRRRRGAARGRRPRPTQPARAVALLDLVHRYLVVRPTGATPRRHRPHRNVHPAVPLGLAGRLPSDAGSRWSTCATRAARGSRASSSSPDRRRRGTHDVQVDAHGLAWVAGSAGTVAYDVTIPPPAPARRTDRRGAVPPVEQLDPPQLAAGLRSHAARHRGGPPARLSPRWKLSDLEDRAARASAGRWIASASSATPRARLLCSAHYFDHRNGLVAAGFFEQGVRFLRVSDPRRITQVGYYVPQRAMAWGALYPPTDPAGEVVYVIDHARGIDVLALDRSALRPVRRKAPPASPSGPCDSTSGRCVDDGFDVARPGRAARHHARGRDVREAGPRRPARAHAAADRPASAPAARRPLRPEHAAGYGSASLACGTLRCAPFGLGCGATPRSVLPST